MHFAQLSDRTGTIKGATVAEGPGTINKSLRATDVIDNFSKMTGIGPRCHGTALEGDAIMKFWRLLWRVVDYVMAVILMLMIVLVFANVVLRYGLSSGLREAVELSRLGLVWLVMLGAAVLLRRNEHLAIAEFSEVLMPRLVPLLRRLAYLVVVVSMVMLFMGSFKQMNANWNNISQITGLPSALFYLAGTVSAALMVFIGAVRVFLPDALLDDDAKDTQAGDFHA